MRISIYTSLVLLAVGCGGDDGGGGGGGNLGLDQLGPELGESTCAKIFDCCSETEVMDMFEGIDPPITSPAECEQFYAAFVAGFLTGPAQDAIDRGTLVYRGDLAADCLAAFDALTCEDLQTFSDPPVDGCEAIFEGQLADDAECVTDLECASGFCDGDSLNGDPGVCRTRPGDGDPCDTFDCEDGFFCDTSGTGSGTCVPALADGAECTFDGDCQSDNCEGTCMPAVPECTGV